MTNTNIWMNLPKVQSEETEKICEQIKKIDFDQIINLYKNAKKVPEINQTKIEHINVLTAITPNVNPSWNSMKMI